MDRRLVGMFASDSSSSCTAGFLAPRVAVLGYGDGLVAVVRPRTQTMMAFEAPAEGEQPTPLQTASSLEIASAACQLQVNADADLVVALTPTAVHFLSLSADCLLSPVRSVALTGEEYVLLATWVPFKPRTLLILAKSTSSPWQLSSQTIFVPEATAGPTRRHSGGRYSTRSNPSSSAMSSPALQRFGAGGGGLGLVLDINNDVNTPSSARRSPHASDPHLCSTHTNSPAERPSGADRTLGFVADSPLGLSGVELRMGADTDSVMTPHKVEVQARLAKPTPTRALDHLMSISAGRCRVHLPGAILCVVAAAQDL